MLNDLMKSFFTDSKLVTFLYNRNIARLANGQLFFRYWFIRSLLLFFLIVAVISLLRITDFDSIYNWLTQFKKVDNFFPNYLSNHKCDQAAFILKNNYEDRQLVNIYLGDSNMLKLELAKSQLSIVQGLSNRQQLAIDGMIFVLPIKKVWSFWMKDMLFNLDIVWLSSCKVVGWNLDLPAPRDGGRPIVVASPEPIDMVIELISGQVERLGLQVGDQLKLVEY